MNFKIAIIRTALFKDNKIPLEFKTFKPIVIKHFQDNKYLIYERIKSLVNSEYDNKEDYVSVYNMRITYNYTELQKQFEELLKKY